MEVSLLQNEYRSNRLTVLTLEDIRAMQEMPGIVSLAGLNNNLCNKLLAPQAETTAPAAKSPECGECGTTAKYTCPRCGVRSCSLGCVRAHKTSSGCSGVRERAKLVYKEDMDNLTLLNDYSTKRVPDDRPSLPHHLQHLKNRAAQRGTTLKFMPSFFLSHRENSTRFHFKEGVIRVQILAGQSIFERNFPITRSSTPEREFPRHSRWHIKWVFQQADVTLIDRSVEENTSLSKLLARYMNPRKNELSPENNEKLAYYHSASYSRICVLMKTDVPETGIVFKELELRKSLKVNFANKSITEYPVLFVILRDHMYSYLDYQDVDGHDDLFGEGEGKEEQGKEGLRFFNAGSDMESE
ncbi:Box C/D snoRNA protein 1 [Chionoecetes opilio]|uniref:Box C/D snoRNA protein 1 n=1 Tax=Chionoecetes opilio TaxID=41210 RepID=A0A8J4Y413_CHIOP|nr:Box C/D snoRNA protein 1 [Chionoecetes opilio]